MAKKIERKSSKQRKQEYADSQKAYFEAILQLRGHSEDQFNQIVDQIEQSNCKINKHVFVNANDVDLYLTSQKYIMQLERWLKEHFNNINITFSRTLHTRDTRRGKDLYRITLCVRFLKYGVGDIIDYKGEKIKITKIGKKPSGKIMTTGKRIFIEAKDLL